MGYYFGWIIDSRHNDNQCAWVEGQSDDWARRDIEGYACGGRGAAEDVGYSRLEIGRCIR
jgi:hypothetical protein